MNQNTPQPKDIIAQFDAQLDSDANRPSQVEPQQYVNSTNAAAAERVELDGRKQFFELRQKWSMDLSYWISTLIIFHIFLTFFIGLNLLNFEKYQWFIQILVVEDFLQIVGMGFIVVNFLYPYGKKKPKKSGGIRSPF